MKTTPWNKNTSEIVTKGIGAIRGKYLEKIGESTIKGISLPKGTELFILVIKDFKKGTLSSDELSSFGFEIFHGVAKHFPNSDLFQASLSASDLRFYLHTKGSYGELIWRFEDIDKFYEKNKVS